MYMYIQSTSQTIWIFLEFGRGVYKSNSYLQYLFRITIYFLGTFALGLFQLIRWWQIFSSKFLVSIWFLLWCVDFNIWGEINKGEKKILMEKFICFDNFANIFMTMRMLLERDIPSSTPVKIPLNTPLKSITLNILPNPRIFFICYFS